MIYEKYHGEDGCDKFIRETFYIDYSYKGVLIEVGAAGPELFSISKHFRENGWRCVSIEPVPYFAKLHRDLGHEIIECACSDQDRDDVDFQMINCYGTKENSGTFTYESNSSFKVKEEFVGKVNRCQMPDGGWRTFDNGIGDITNIKVNSRTLNTILSNDQTITKIDVLTIDTEGWELEVLGGINLLQHKVKVILIENCLHDSKYDEYLNRFGYKLKHKTQNNYVFSYL